MDETASRGGKLYDAIPIKGDDAAVINGTKATLADLNRGLKSNAELSALVSDPRLQAYQRAFEGSTEQVPIGLLDSNGNPMTRTVQRGGGLSWQDLKSFRSYVGELAGKPSLQNDTSQGKLKALYSALSQDMEATALQKGPRALTAFRRANDYWRGRENRIGEVITPLLGKKMDATSEGAFKTIQNWAKEGNPDFSKVARLFRSLPEDEANTVRASILTRLGMVSKGRQDETSEVFSPSDFLTHWNDLDKRAKGVLFQGQHAKDLDDIAKVAAGMKASSRYANTSKTGIAVGATGTVSAAMEGILTGGLTIAAQIGSGLLLGNPAFAKWLAALARKPGPSAALAHIERLDKLARSNPQIASDVLEFQEKVAQQFAQPVGRAAASNENGENQ